MIEFLLGVWVGVLAVLWTWLYFEIGSFRNFTWDDWQVAGLMTIWFVWVIIGLILWPIEKIQNWRAK